MKKMKEILCVCSSLLDLMVLHDERSIFFYFKMIEGLKLSKLTRSMVDHLQCWYTLIILG